jgi:hypothetical protein
MARGRWVDGEEGEECKEVFLKGFDEDEGDRVIRVFNIISISRDVRVIILMR